MGSIKAELTTTGDLKLAGNINTRLPPVTGGLIAHFPFDGTAGTFDMIGGVQSLQNTSKGVNLIEAMNINWRDPLSWASGSGMAYNEEMDAMKVVGYRNTWLRTPIIVNTSFSYEISIDVMQTIYPSSGLYLGGYSLDENGALATNNYDYTMAANDRPALNEWKTYRLTRTGTATAESGTTTSFSTVKGWTGNAGRLIKYYYFGGLFNYSSGGELYIRNLSIRVINNDTSGTTITNDYIGIGPSTGTLKYKLDLSSTTTISFDYYCKNRISKTVISNSQYNSKWWGLYLNSSGYLYTHEGSGGGSHTSSYLMPLNTWVHITIKWTTTTQYYYADGVLLGSIATNGANTAANIPELSLGYGWNRGDAHFKNLSVYDRVLSDNEIKQLNNTSFNLQPNGDLITSKLITRLNLGTGSNGSFTAGVNSIVNSYDYITNTTILKGSTTITIESGNITAGDEILIIQMQDYLNTHNVGTYEINKAVHVASNIITLEKPLSFNYTSGTNDSASSQTSQVIKIPNYNSVTIGSGKSITCPEWNGKFGGVIVFRSLQPVSNAGIISASGKGYRGGRASGVGGYSSSDGECGEGYTGRGVPGFYSGNTPIVKDNGGTTYVGGAGGSHKTAGNNATPYGGFTGLSGFRCGSEDLYKPMFGGGGGGGHSNAGLPMGGNGGGVIIIFANAINGSIESNGQDGWCYNNDQGLWGSGGGAGGSIYIEASNFSGSFSVVGGIKGPSNAGRSDGQGGNGGEGRERVYLRGLSGTEKMEVNDGINIQNNIITGQAL